MKREDKRDLVLVGASLLGIAVGGILDDLQAGTKPTEDSSDDSGQDESDDVGETAGSGSSRALISVPALMTATSLSRRLGEQAGWRADRLWSQALLAFCVGAALTYFADGIRRWIPGARSG